MRRFLSLLTAGLLIAGCSPTGSGGAATSSATASPRHYNVPGPNELILRLETGGGIMPPPTYLYSYLPTLSLYGDGRIVQPGAINGRMYFADHPSDRPLLPDPWVMRITPEEIQRIVAAADEAGLLGRDASYSFTDEYEPADFSVFTLVADGQRHTTSASALYYSDVADDPANEAVRAKLKAFRNKITDLPEFLGRPMSREDYEPTAMRLFFDVADEAPDTSGLTRQVVDWPLAVDPATAGEPTGYPLHLRCLVISGADLDAFLTVARTADELTIWKAASGRYSVMVRPLLPDESGCGIL